MLLIALISQKPCMKLRIRVPHFSRFMAHLKATATVEGRQSLQILWWKANHQMAPGRLARAAKVHTDSGFFGTIA